MRRFLWLLGLAALFTVPVVPLCIELPKLGWNAYAIDFAGILFFTLWGNLELHRKANLIWSNENKATSIPLYLAMATMFVSQAHYGFGQDSLVLVFASISRFFFHGPILQGLARLRLWRSWEKVMALALLAFVAFNLASAQRHAFYLAASVIGVAAYLNQPIRMWRLESTEGVRWQLHLAYGVNGVFWIVYGRDSQDLLIIINSSCLVLINAAIIWLAFKCRDAPQTASTKQVIDYEMVP